MKQELIRKIWNPAMECMDRSKLRELQNERLRATVRLEYDNVPLYRARMDAMGVKPEDIQTVDDLRKLPFTEKTDLRDQFPYGLFAQKLTDIVRIQGSSGTTGKPIVVGYTQNDIDVWTEMVARALTAAGGTEDDIIQICYGYGLFTGGLGAHQGASRIGATVIPMSAGNTQRQIMMMTELGATMLCCTPSYAIYLAETIKEMDMMDKIHLKSGCFGAEPWTEEMRKHLEDLFGMKACDIYGLTEIGGPGVAYECLEQTGMHVNEDNVIVEIVNPETGEPLPVGEKGELVFTTITKTGMPMLRYRTHDICSLSAEPCKCGRTFIKMSRLTGRTDDMLVIRGVNVFPSQIETCLVGLQGVAPFYRLIVDRVNSTDKLEVQVELAEDMFTDKVSDLENLRGMISERIKSVVGIAAKVTLVAPKSLPRTEGKSKHVVDNRNLTNN